MLAIYRFIIPILGSTRIGAHALIGHGHHLSHAVHCCHASFLMCSVLAHGPPKHMSALIGQPLRACVVNVTPLTLRLEGVNTAVATVTMVLILPYHDFLIS